MTFPRSSGGGGSRIAAAGFLLVSMVVFLSISASGEAVVAATAPRSEKDPNASGFSLRRRRRRRATEVAENDNDNDDTGGIAMASVYGIHKSPPHEDDAVLKAAFASAYRGRKKSNLEMEILRAREDGESDAVVGAVEGYESMNHLWRGIGMSMGDSEDNNGGGNSNNNNGNNNNNNNNNNGNTGGVGNGGGNTGGGNNGGGNTGGGNNGGGNTGGGNNGGGGNGDGDGDGGVGVPTQAPGDGSNPVPTRNDDGGGVGPATPTVSDAMPAPSADDVEPTPTVSVGGTPVPSVAAPAYFTVPPGGFVQPQPESTAAPAYFTVPPGGFVEPTVATLPPRPTGEFTAPSAAQFTLNPTRIEDALPPPANGVVGGDDAEERSGYPNVVALATVGTLGVTGLIAGIVFLICRCRSKRRGSGAAV